MQATMQVGIDDEFRHTKKLVGLVSWGAGALLAIAVAWQLGHVGRRIGSGPASFVDWSVEGPGNPVEVDGTLVMPEDQLVSHRPPSTGAAEAQKR
jgi:hypothetical protein